MKHRPEIDGLRAIAVVPVILLHAGFELFSGGFVGVDIFFVISGYLITSILIQNMNEGRFRLLEFYDRRARRILPALFFLTLTCVPFAWLWLLPFDKKDFAASLVAVTTFSSNILFWQQSDYFATSAALKPLLHTWSLAVEEQYYLLFPIFLMLTRGLGQRRVILLIAIVFAISLSIAQWGAYYKPTPAFYLLPTRSWELLLGSFVAYYPLERKDHFTKRAQNVLSGIGLLLITYSIFAYDSTTPFPGAYALVPTIGTVLLILFAHKGTLAKTALSNKALVGIGLVSYSAYLWHHPIFAFYLYRTGSTISNNSLVSMTAFTALAFISYMSWRFIERPIRRRAILKGNRSLCLAFGAIGSIVIGMGAYGYVSIRSFDNFKDWAIDVRLHECLLQEETEVEHALICYSDNTDILLWGDSHAASLSIGLRELSRKLDVGFTQLTQAGCPPILGLPLLFNRKGCNDLNEEIFARATREQYDLIILHASWTHPDYRLTDTQLDELFGNTLKEIRAMLPDSRIIVVGNVPVWQRSVFQELRFGITLNGDNGVIYGDAITSPEVEKRLSGISLENDVEYVDTNGYLCTMFDAKQKCMIGFGNKDTEFQLGYIDAAHMSRLGSIYLVDSALSERLEND